MERLRKTVKNLTKDHWSNVWTLDFLSIFPECLSRNAGSQFVPVTQIHDAEFSKCEITQPAWSLLWNKLASGCGLVGLPRWEDLLFSFAVIPVKSCSVISDLVYMMSHPIVIVITVWRISNRTPITSVPVQYLQQNMITFFHILHYCSLSVM